MGMTERRASSVIARPVGRDATDAFLLSLAGALASYETRLS